MRLTIPAALTAVLLGTLGAGVHASAKPTKAQKAAAAMAAMPNPARDAAEKIFAKLTDKNAEKAGRSEKIVLLERALDPLLQSSSSRLRKIGAALDDQSFERMTAELSGFAGGEGAKAQRSRASMMLAALHWTMDATAEAQEAAAQAAQLDPTYTQPLLLQGRIYDRLGKPEEAERALRAALKTVRRSKDSQLKNETVASAEGLLGHIYVSGGDFPAADSAFTDCAQRYDEMGDKEGRAFCLAGVGDVARRQGRYRQSERALLAALAVYKERGNAEGQAMALNSLGALAEDNGAVKAAERYYRAALEKNKSTGRREGEAANTANLGTLYFGQQRYAEAEQMYRSALESLAMLDAPGEAAFQYGNLALVARARGDYKEADSLHHNALTLCKQAANPLCEAVQTKGLAETAALSGDTSGALAQAKEASKLYAQLEAPQPQEAREVSALLAKIPGGAGALAGASSEAAVPANVPEAASAPSAAGGSGEIPAARTPVKAAPAPTQAAAPAAASSGGGRTASDLSPGEGMAPFRLPGTGGTAAAAPVPSAALKYEGLADEGRGLRLGVAYANAAETRRPVDAARLPAEKAKPDDAEDGAPAVPDAASLSLLNDSFVADDDAGADPWAEERSLADMDEALWSGDFF